jgi:hypothetical protein
MNASQSNQRPFLQFRMRTLLLFVFFAAAVSAGFAYFLHRPRLVFDGFCPVALVDGKRWLQGDPKYQMIHENQAFRFVSEKDQQAFLSSPDRYMPVLSGHDIVRMQDDGVSVPGKREHGVFYDGRVYLFASESSLAIFCCNVNKYQLQSGRHK